MIRPPIAGHHIQWIGSLRNASSDRYTSEVASQATKPPTAPAAAHSSRSGKTSAGSA